MNTILESILALAAERNDTPLREVPTVSSIDAIQAALEFLPSALPDTGLGEQETIEKVKQYLLPALAPGQAGPRYFGFVVGGVLPAAQYGDILTTLYDQNAGVSGGPSQSITATIEDRALRMILQLLDLPVEEFRGRTFTTGATAANVLGLACAREHTISTHFPNHSVAEHGLLALPSPIHIKIFADRAHASLIKAASLVGLGRTSIIQLANRIEDIELQLSQNNQNHIGVIVSLSFGEVNTGEFTAKVPEIRALCDKFNVWLHIDGAFGAFARISPTLKHLAAGLELADSIACDGHKWLNVPYDSGIFYTKSSTIQSSIFGPSPFHPPPPYLNTTPTSEELALLTPEMQETFTLPAQFTLGIESSRRFRALAAYCALLSIGKAGYTELVERNVKFARQVADWMTSGEGKTWYRVLNLSEPQEGMENEKKTIPLNIVLFSVLDSPDVPSKFRPSNPEGGRELLKSINEKREVYLSPGPKGALRIAVSNWMTGLDVNKRGECDMEVLVRTLRDVMSM